MACLNCNHPKTIVAHLLPKAFVQEVKSTSGEQLMIVHENLKTKVSNTGTYDRNLLCGACDTLLGAHEGYIFKLLKRLRALDARLNTLVPIDPVDGDVVVRFAAGIAWKFANTQPGQGRIDIGSYSDVLRDVSLRNGPIPVEVDVAMIRLVELDGDVYFFREPKPDRREQVNMVRFSVGSFLFFLKIDKRRNGSVLPAASWLRGRSSGAFLVAPAEAFEEGRMHRVLAGSLPVSGFFREMKKRQALR